MKQLMETNWLMPVKFAKKADLKISIRIVNNNG